MKGTSPPQPPEFFSQQVRKANRFFRSFDHTHSGLGFIVVAGGIENCAPGYRVERSSFRYYGVEYVAAGEGVIAFGRREYRITPGSMFCYGPGVSHAIAPARNRDIIKCFMDVTGGEAEAILEKQLELPGRVLQTTASQSLYQGFEELIYYGQSVSPYAGSICDALGRSMIYKLMHFAADHGEMSEGAYSVYQRCKDIIRNNFLELVSLQDAAAACAVSPSYLCRLFRLYDQQTPYRYLQSLKMSYAADVMDRGGMRVKDAARLLGYDDMYHFSRTFKRIMGLSPMNFFRHEMHHPAR